MRTSSQVLIFVNLEKALAAGIKFYLSSNGVVLTPGNQLGFLETKFFARVEKIRMKKTLLLGEAIPDLPETTWTSEDVTTEPALKTGEGKSTSDLP
jgi:2'-phosphotransferase